MKQRHHSKSRSDMKQRHYRKQRSNLEIRFSGRDLELPYIFDQAVSYRLGVVMALGHTEPPNARTLCRCPDELWAPAIPFDWFLRSFVDSALADGLFVEQEHNNELIRVRGIMSPNSHAKRVCPPTRPVLPPVHGMDRTRLHLSSVQMAAERWAEMGRTGKQQDWIKHLTEDNRRLGRLEDGVIRRPQ